MSLHHVFFFFCFCLSPVYSWFLSLQLVLMKRLCFSCHMHLCLAPPPPRCCCFPPQQFLFVLRPHGLASPCLPCWLSEVQLELSPLTSPFPCRLMSPSDRYGACLPLRLSLW